MGFNMPTTVLQRCGVGLMGLAQTLTLAGCLLALPTGGVHQITVLDGSVNVQAPQGYCIDQEASASLGPAIVVLIGRCTVAGQVAAAVVTLTIGAPASAGVLLAGPDALGQFFASRDGRTVLARDGDPAHVTVLQTQISGSALLLHVNDQTAGEYWRAISAINGRLVTISASGVEGAPLTPGQGLDLVRETMELLAKRNPVRPKSAPPVAPTPVPKT